LPLEIFQAAVVLDNVVCEAAFFRQAHLRIDMLLSGFNVETIALLQAALLNSRVAGDQDHRAKPFVQVSFKEQRHFVNNNLISSGGVLADALFGKGAHARMDDRFERLSGGGIVEDRCAQLLPIESLISLQDFDAECVDDVFPSILSRFDNFPRQSVGVDDRRTQPFQDRRDGALARGDAAG
jgi:hypothetical protein